MKKWAKPEFKTVETATSSGTLTVDLCSGTTTTEEYFDRGTCHNAYWAGNGLTKEEATANNPYWGGGWGNGGGWGSNGGWGN